MELESDAEVSLLEEVDSITGAMADTRSPMDNLRRRNSAGYEDGQGWGGMPNAKQLQRRRACFLTGLTAVSLLVVLGLAVAVGKLRALWFAASAAEGPPETSAGFGVAKRVIVVGIDGLGGIYLQNASHEMPTLTELIGRGSSTMHARSQLPLISGPNWAGILTGMSPESTGIFDNHWRRNNVEHKVLAACPQGQPHVDVHQRAPGVWNSQGGPRTMFEAAAEANISSAVSYTWEWLAEIVPPETKGIKHDFHMPREAEESRLWSLPDERATDRAIEFLRDPDVRLHFLYLGLVDEAGHGLVSGGTGGLPPWRGGQDRAEGERRRRAHEDTPCTCIAPCLPYTYGPMAGTNRCRTYGPCSEGDNGTSFTVECKPGTDYQGWNGWGSANYYKAAKAADERLARVIRSLEDSSTLDSTLIVVVADHGGFRYTHGAFLQESDMFVPVVLAGPGVLSAHGLTRATTLDIAPTVLHALGVPPWADGDGRVLTDAFRSTAKAGL